MMLEGYKFFLFFLLLMTWPPSVLIFFFWSSFPVSLTKRFLLRSLEVTVMVLNYGISRPNQRKREEGDRLKGGE